MGHSLPMDDQIVTTIGILGLALAGTIAYLVLASGRTRSGDNLEISQLYVYPVKGIRGCSLRKAYLGPYGVIGDRTFCIQKVIRDEIGVKYETMFIGYYLQLALFQASVDYSDDPRSGEIEIEWKGRGTKFDVAQDVKTSDKIRFPLQPSTIGKTKIEVDLHTSKTDAYDMGDELSQWFVERLGFEVKLVYIGDGSRPVLGSFAPNSPAGLKSSRMLTRLKAMVPFLALPAERLAFNDIAHYLVVTEESNEQVTSRLTDGLKMDVTKFRPNIVVKGASNPYAEDYWGELTFSGGITMPLTANCYRCQSITVDYDTGATATDDRGMAWKKLNKDRRVDKGAKYSPVFGRYGYCFGNAVGCTLQIGQGAKVTHVNPNRTTFDWPSLTTFGVTQTKK